MSSAYERELKNILEAEQKTLNKVTTSLDTLAKNDYYRIKDKPFIVVRAAGSFGFDLVALRGDMSFLVEIKTSVFDTIHFSSTDGKLQQQADKMKQQCEKTKTLPVYAFRLKNYRGDNWRVFTIDIDNLEGRLNILHRIIPKLDYSRNGNYVLRWRDGLPLSEFLAYLCK